MTRHRFKAAPRFWRSYKKLSESQKESAKAAWKIFKENPFDPRLRPHKIHALSAVHRHTIHAICIEGDLRAVFYVEKDTVWSVDIGTHSIYR